MRKFGTYLLMGSLAAGLLMSVASCGTSSSGSGDLSGSVTCSGSSALAPLASDAAGKFMDLHPDVTVEVNAGGSGTGLKNVSEGTVDIGDSDVYASEKLDSSAAEELVDHKVATIGVAAVVNEDVYTSVKNITTQQLIDIFTGVTTNWSALGGPDETIIRCTRPTSSGTRALFKSYALSGNDEVKDANGLESDNSGDLYTKVKGTSGAIGYLAMSYLVNNTEVGLLSIDGVAANYTNIYSGTYKVWGYEHMYTKGEGSDVAQAFIGYIMSDDYSGSIESQGYGVSSKMSDTATQGR